MFRHVTVRSTAGKEPIQMGAVVSTTIKVWLPSMKLPQSSVAVQVRMRVYLDGHGPSTISSVSTTSTLSSQLSTAVKIGGTGTALHSTVTSDGISIDHSGAPLSETTISCVATDSLPVQSVAVHVRITVNPAAQPASPIISSAKSTSTAPSHTSVAVYNPASSNSPQLMFKSPGIA